MKSRLGIVASVMLLSACSIVPSTSSEPVKSPSVERSSEAATLEPGEDPYYQPLWTLNDVGFQINASTSVEIVGDTAIIRSIPIPATVPERMPGGLDERDWTDYTDRPWLTVVDIPSGEVRWEMPASMASVSGLDGFNPLPEVQDPGVYIAGSDVVVGFLNDAVADLDDLSMAGVAPGIASIDPETMRAKWAHAYKPVVRRDGIKVWRQFVGAHDELVIQTIDEFTGGDMDGEPKRTWHRRTQAFHASTGELAWERKGLVALSVSNGVVLARTLPLDSTAKHGSPFEALDAETGKTLWRTKSRTNLFGISDDWVLFARDAVDTHKNDPTKGVYALRTGVKKLGLAGDEGPAFPVSGDGATHRVAAVGDGVVWSSSGRKPNMVSWLSDGASSPVSKPMRKLVQPTPVVANDRSFAYEMMGPWRFLDERGEAVGDPLPLNSNDARIVVSGSYLALIPEDTESLDATISFYKLIQ
ncbi:hypothetical protein [Nocardioides sp.]|uniref:hypothetical protein n=1 Tax=Nocardioides sp. TaxID=35761 RepID=UPI001995D155|nr:hypothetical protein [Nocardioides sp.]MBC7279170.1 PQQ-like beta-propeller repeat protein [Nocardioides sp.]